MRGREYGKFQVLQKCRESPKTHESLYNFRYNDGMNMGMLAWNLLKTLAGTTGLEPATSCVTGMLAASTVFSQFFPFVALTRF